jgi:stage II sporulation protein D
MFRTILLFCFLLTTGLAFGQSPADANIVRIGISGGDGHQSAEFFVSEGRYEIVGDGEVISTLTVNQDCALRPTSNQVEVRKGGRVLGRYKRVLLRSTEWESRFRLSATGAKNRYLPSVYPDHLVVKTYGNKLILINECSLERYVAGVAEAESGRGQELEYYKVQAIIARTYALANLRRHATEGFNLCDRVHCQAYHGASRFEEKIPMATWDTKDHVLVDPNINLVTAAFHSNCGGHTLNAEHVWSRPLPYLVGRRDTFCLVMPHSHWEACFPKSAWSNYLAENGHPVSDSTALSYYPAERQRFFADSLNNLRMTRIRSDWRLRSAFFVVEEEADSVRITGRGFGHGVGLCQEGAMRMARLGYSSNDILHFYYKDVHLIDKKHIGFFREE